MILLDDMATYLQPLLAPVPVQKGFMQELPVQAVALRETGGFPPQYVNTGQPIFDEPTLQIVTRAKDYPTAMGTCRTAYDRLGGNAGLRNLTLNGLLYHFVSAMQPPFFLMRDDNNNFLCAFNIRITRRTS